MDELFQDKSDIIPKLIQELMFEDNIIRRLNGTQVLLNAIDENIGDALGIKKEQAWLNTIIDNTQLMRKIRFITKIIEVPETALELYGQDYYSHPEFYFDANFHKRITDINKRISKILGSVLKEYTKGEEFEI